MQRSTQLDRVEGREARQGRRACVERLLALAEHLPPADRTLMTAVYRDGRSFSELAELTRVPPRRLSRRVARLIRRMRRPAYRFVAQRGSVLPRDVERVGRYIHLQGLSLRDTARATDQPLHRVRQHAHALQCIADALEPT